MTEFRWILAAACGLFFLICVSVSFAVAVRWYWKRERGSGLWFAGSIVAFAGVLLAPVGTLWQRLPYALLPLAFELLLLAALVLIDRIVQRYREVDD